jgi:hypothetical protein
MDRQIVYSGAIPLETDLLNTNKNMMVALSKLAAAVLGISTIANGFAVTATSPASMQVNVAAGEIYALANIDATAYSSLAADTTHSILKQGIALDAQTLTLAAPGTAGQSINYLIQATYQDQDANAVALPYYNSSNPSLPWSGPNNSGSTQYTTRKGAAVISAKAGIAATTGSQQTPAPDSGYVGLYVVTVAYGQATITTSNISQYSAAPLLPGGLLQAIQTGNVSFGIDTGTANNYVVNCTPALSSRTEGQVIRFKAKTANNGASTLWDGVGTAPLVGGAHIALQSGEIVANGDCWAQWNSSVGGSGSYILLLCTGAPEQMANATQSQHAIAFGQLTGMVGSTRNAKMYISAASASGTFTADEIIAETALGGLQYRLANFSKTINLATTGAGGMDTGSAPVSGYVALYAIYNPTTSTANILATNATSAAAPSVYGGANMPSGYTASALIGVWPTNASGQFKVGLQRDRTISFPLATALSSSVVQGSLTSLSISGVVPPNATQITGELSLSSTSSSTAGLSVAADANGVGQQNSTATVTATGYIANFMVPLASAQTIYWNSSNTAGTPTYVIYISTYSF